LSLTADQRTALDPFATVWVDAAAGSGKTQVLVARMLRLLLEGARPESLLCLTFTKAAAAEMAQRLMGRLAHWATAADGKVAADLEALGVAPEDERIVQARALFALVLELEGGLRISTLHGFCQSLLARFPLEAEIEPGFGLLEGHDQSAMIGDVLLSLARVAVADPDPRLLDAFASFGEVAGGGKTQAAILGMIRACGAIVATDGIARDGLLTVAESQFDPPDARDFADWLRREFPAGLAVHLHAFATALERHGSDTEQDKVPAIRAAAQVAATDLVEAWTLFRRFYLKSDGTARGSIMNKAVAKACPAVRDEAVRVQAWAVEAHRVEKVFAGAAHARALLLVSLALARAYEAAKQSEGVLDFDDQIARARALLSAAQDGGLQWVLQKLDARIDHILIDEGQDTNPAQWDIVEALSEEFHAGQGAREGTATVFAVGDYNQSIYGFQGADPQSYRAAGERFRARVEVVSQPWKNVALAKSFRSTGAVLDLVNAAFVGEDAPAAGLGGTVHLHVPDRVDVRGRVELWPPVYTESDATREEAAPVDAMRFRQSADERYAAQIAAQVADWLATGRLASRDNRPVMPGDIMILLRKRTRLAQPLLRAFRNLGVPVAGLDRLALLATQVARDCLSLLHFVVQPLDDLALAEVLMSPFIGWSDEALCALAAERAEPSLWAALSRAAGSDDEAAAGARHWLGEALALADWAPPFEFLMTVLEARGGRARLFARLGTGADDALSMLLDLALDYQRRHPPTLQGFVDWLEANDAEITREAEIVRNEVRILTVHGAKGLQAPIVIVAEGHSEAKDQREPLPVPVTPYTNQPGGPTLPIYYLSGKTLPDALAARLAERQQREAEEDLRLLYVALTRAEDWLCVGAHASKEGKLDGGGWYRLVEKALRRLAPMETRPAVWAALGPVMVHETGGVGPPDARLAPVPAQAAVSLPVWASTPPPAEAMPPRPLAPSRALSDAVEQVAPARALAAVRGRVVHRLLELLPEVAPAQRAGWLEAWLSRQAGGTGLAAGLDRAELRSIGADVLSLLADPRFGLVFEGEALAEVPVSGLIGDLVVQGRLDRLVVLPDRVLAVDFKTATRVPADEAGVPPAILAQMAAYHAVLARIFTDRRVDMAVLWTQGPRLTLLSQAGLDAHRPGL